MGRSGMMEICSKLSEHQEPIGFDVLNYGR